MKKRQRGIEPLPGVTECIPMGCGKLYVTANSDADGLFETFIRTSGSGGCEAQSEAIGRLVSLALRYSIPTEEITRQLDSVRCVACIRARDKEGSKVEVKSCPAAIARTIKGATGTESKGPGFEIIEDADKQEDS